MITSRNRKFRLMSINNLNLCPIHNQHRLLVVIYNSVRAASKYEDHLMTNSENLKMRHLSNSRMVEVTL